MTKEEALAIAEEAAKIYFDYNVSAREAIEIVKRKGDNIGISQRRWI